MPQFPVNRFELIGRTLRLGNLLPQERLVLVALIQHVRTSGKKQRQTWIKQHQLAAELQMPERNVRRHLDKLVTTGNLERWRQPHGYLYRIPRVWDETPTVSGEFHKVLANPTIEDDEPWE